MEPVLQKAIDELVTAIRTQERVRAMEETRAEVRAEVSAMFAQPVMPPPPLNGSNGNGHHPADAAVFEISARKAAPKKPEKKVDGRSKPRTPAQIAAAIKNIAKARRARKAKLKAAKVVKKVSKKSNKKKK